MDIPRIAILKNISLPSWVGVFLVITSILVFRLLPHVPNFSPVASIILFALAKQNGKKFLFWPLLALFISDLILGFYAWPIMLSVYGSLALNGLIGGWLKKQINFLNIINASLLSALLFFLITNWAVWATGDWYSHDWSGLIYCYTLAVPFFKNTLASNLLYTPLLFYGYQALCQLLVPAKLLKKSV